MSNPDGDTCRTYDVDGEPVAVHGSQPLNKMDREMLGELVRATERHIERTDPHAGVRQELVAASREAARWIVDPHAADRLKAAVAAARDALTPKAPS